jgi:hypothetical protein
MGLTTKDAALVMISDECDSQCGQSDHHEVVYFESSSITKQDCTDSSGNPLPVARSQHIVTDA